MKYIHSVLSLVTPFYIDPVIGFYVSGGLAWWAICSHPLPITRHNSHTYSISAKRGSFENFVKPPASNDETAKLTIWNICY